MMMIEMCTMKGIRIFKNDQISWRFGTVLQVRRSEQNDHVRNEGINNG